MNDRRAFLNAIIADPEEDTVRLVYADWLDENGNETDRARARLIRLQIQLHRDEDEDGDRRPALIRECDGLIEAHLQDWIHGLTYASFRAHSDFRVFYENCFSRGFLYELPWLQQKNLPDPALDALLTHEPVTTFVMSVPTDEAGEEIARWVQLPRVRQLGFTNVRGNGVRAILRSPLLSGLHGLGAWDTLDEKDVALIASDGRFAGLRRLNLHSNHLDDRAVEIVARSPILSDLTDLEFGGGRTTDDALQAVAASPLAQRLTRLGFARGGQAGGEHAAVVAGFPRLEEIDFGWFAKISDAGAMSLAASPSMASLKRLRIIHGGLGPRGAVAILTSPHLAQLEELDLSLNALGGVWVAAFAAGPRRLRKLILKNIRLDAEAVVRLAEAPGLEEVRELDLSSNLFGDRGAIALARSSRLRRLRRLDLSSCGIGEKGAFALADSPILNRLEGRDGLRMRNPHHGPEAARRLKERLGYDPS